MRTNEQINDLTGQILDACIEVHRHMGPGLLESVYQFALCKELELRDISVRKNVPLELFYKGYATGKTYELDLVAEEEVIIELKAVAQMHPVFEAQLLTYLRLTDISVGLLVNFNVTRLKDGFKRLVHNF